MDDKVIDQFKRWGKAPPAHYEHGVTDTKENPLSEQLEKAECTNWRLEGNTLTCDTQFGPLTQVIPPDYICKGTDKDGMPILVKIGA